VFQLSLGEGCVSSAEVPKSRRIRDAVDMSLRPLSEKLDCALYECSILSSLGLFTHPELLTGSNKFACSFCNRKDRRKNSSTNGRFGVCSQRFRVVLYLFSQVK